MPRRRAPKWRTTTPPCRFSPRRPCARLWAVRPWSRWRCAANWGVDIISVKVRDIRIPDELQEAMSLEAQADREKNARMSVASVESDLAEMLAEAARIYGDPDAALKLRTMLMQYDTVKKSKSAVVTVPSSFSDGFADAADKAGADGLGRAPSDAARGGRP